MWPNPHPYGHSSDSLGQGQHPPSVRTSSTYPMSLMIHVSNDLLDVYLRLVKEGFAAPTPSAKNVVAASLTLLAVIGKQSHPRLSCFVVPNFPCSFRLRFTSNAICLAVASMRPGTLLATLSSSCRKPTLAKCPEFDLRGASPDTARSPMRAFRIDKSLQSSVSVL